MTTVEHREDKPACSTSVYLDGVLSEDQKTACVKTLYAMLDDVSDLMNELVNGAKLVARREATKGSKQQ